MHEAISILKEHKTFLHKQQVLVKRHCERTACLARAVSSRGCVRGMASATEGSSPTRNSGKRGVTQADKNRKRKLKKKRAKEKRHKIDQTIEM